jgi:hypothetical protein
MVLMSITMAPAFTPLATPFSPNSTSSTTAVSGTMVITMGLAAATSRGEAATLAPRGASLSHWLRTWSKTVTSNPARKRLEAIGPPITPTPMNPNLPWLPRLISSLMESPLRSHVAAPGDRTKIWMRPQGNFVQCQTILRAGLAASRCVLVKDLFQVR